jgi:hypothetical protein
LATKFFFMKNLILLHGTARKITYTVYETTHTI